MNTLLLMLTLGSTAALADTPLAFDDEEDLEDDLDWDDDGSRPDSESADPDADPTWDVGEDDLPLDLEGDDPGWDGSGPTDDGPSLSDDPDWDAPDDGLREEGPSRAAPAAKPVRPGASGRTPLADNYPVEVIHSDLESVVIELPVLVSQRRDEVSGDFWLIGEIYLGGSKVGESRALVTPAGLTEDGPSFVWIQAQLPAAESTGTVEIKLSQQAVGGASKALFSRSTTYKL